MADEHEEEEVGPVTREGAEQAAALGALTDAAAEREVGDGGDQAAVRAAIEALASARRERAEAERARERALAAVKVRQEDVDVIAAEFELDKKAAERRLREAGGDARAAIDALLAA